MVCALVLCCGHLPGSALLLLVASLSVPLSLSPSLTSLVAGDSWGHSGDISDIAVGSMYRVAGAVVSIFSFFPFFWLELVTYIVPCDTYGFLFLFEKKSIVFVYGRQLFGARPL